MREQGVVTRILSSQLVEVACQKTAACAKCRACHEAGENMLALEAVNEIQAKQDDVVEFELSSQALVKSSLLIFVLPMLALIAGYLFTVKVFPVGEIWGVLGSLLAFALSFIVINWYDRRFSAKARLIRVISSA